MRVLHVMEATIGGTRRHLLDVALGQQRSGLQVAVAASALRTQDFEHDLERMAAVGVEVLRLPMRREIAPRSDWQHAAQLQRFLRSWQPQIVHTHSSKAGALGRWASMRTGIGARVHTPHTFAFLFESMFSASKRWMFREIERQLALRTQAIVAVSHDERATIAASGIVPTQRLVVIENGIDPLPYAQAQALPRESLGVRADQPLFLCAGLWNAAKGQDLLLEALCAPGLEQVQVLLAGEGELRPQLEAWIRTHALGSRVQLLGYRKDVPALLRSVDALVLPSRWEGMPYIALEALAAGTPICATPVDGARSLIHSSSAGLLASAISAEAIAQVLREFLALSPAKRLALQNNARQFAQRQGHLERMLQELNALYERVA